MIPAKPLETLPVFLLGVAPVKKGRIDLVAEKACELGVARLQPVLTRRAVVDKMNLPRLHSHLVEAAEQCGRTALTELGEMVKLQNLMKTRSQSRHLVFADEQGSTPSAEELSDRATTEGRRVG